MVADEIKHRQSVFVANYFLAINQTRSHRQRANGYRDKWKAPSEVIAVAANQAHTGTIAPGHDPKAILLDFMNPSGPGRGAFAGDGRHGSIMPSPGWVRSRNNDITAT
jgi:hypothetical protein